jgi:undecaprenyl pyrophosphate phosphatase UppP
VCVSIKAHTAHNRYCFFLGSPFFFVALSLELWHHRRIYNEERETCVCTGRSSSSRSSSQFLFLPVYSFFYLFSVCTLTSFYSFWQEEEVIHHVRGYLLGTQISFFFFFYLLFLARVWNKQNMKRQLSVNQKPARAWLDLSVLVILDGHYHHQEIKGSYTHKYKRRWSVLDV